MFSRFPHAIQRPPTQAISPYVFAVSPYGHTPAASPHTSRQIPIGRPFSHSHVRSPIARPSPHTIHKLQKSGFHFDETSGSSSTNPNQPRQANILNLRYTSANQAPAKSSKCYRPATGGVQSPPACTAMVIYIHGHAHGQAHTCTVTHAHAFTGMRISARPWRKPIRRDQRTAQQIPNQPCQADTLKLRNASANLQSNCYSKPLGGMGDDDAATPATPRRGPSCCML